MASAQMFFDPEQEVKVIAVCGRCDKEVPLKVRVKDINRYEQEPDCHVQDAFPYLTPGERELFLSGICETCFDELMLGPDDPDEDEEDGEGGES